MGKNDTFGYFIKILCASLFQLDAHCLDINFCLSIIYLSTRQRIDFQHFAIEIGLGSLFLYHPFFIELNFFLRFFYSKAIHD